MRTSRSVLRFMIAISVSFALILLVTFPFQPRGTGARPITVLTLAILGGMILFGFVGLWRDWDLFWFLDEWGWE